MQIAAAIETALLGCPIFLCTNIDQQHQQRRAPIHCRVPPPSRRRRMRAVHPVARHHVHAGPRCLDATPGPCGMRLQRPGLHVAARAGPCTAAPHPWRSADASAAAGSTGGCTRPSGHVLHPGMLHRKQRCHGAAAGALSREELCGQPRLASSTGRAVPRDAHESPACSCTVSKACQPASHAALLHSLTSRPRRAAGACSAISGDALWGLFTPRRPAARLPGCPQPPSGRPAPSPRHYGEFQAAWQQEAGRG